jgi:hypothetical protein
MTFFQRIQCTALFLLSQYPFKKRVFSSFFCKKWQLHNKKINNTIGKQFSSLMNLLSFTNHVGESMKNRGGTT